MYKVYKLTFPDGKGYVGMTAQNLDRRWRGGQGYTHNAPLTTAINSCGWENVRKEILYDNLDLHAACKLECEMIAQHETHKREFGYNFTYGGINFEFTEDVKERLTENHPRSWCNRKHTDATKAKISEANKGRTHTEEQRRRMSASAKNRPPTFAGKKHSEEARKKISENHARAYGALNPSAKKVKCVETGEIFETIKEAAEAKSASRTHISSCCNGRRNKCGGYHWIFVG